MEYMVMKEDEGMEGRTWGCEGGLRIGIEDNRMG